MGLNAARAYGIDVEAARCGIRASELAMLKRSLDHELGGRRWAFLPPKLRSRREFFRTLEQKNFRPG